jgi:hypothetical protein
MPQKSQALRIIPPILDLTVLSVVRGQWSVVRGQLRRAEDSSAGNWQSKTDH